MIDPSTIAATLTNTPTVLRTLLAPVAADVLAERPEPGEWCVLEVIGHLIACDRDAFRNRIAAIVAGEPDIASFDPWAAITERDFAAASLDDVLAELEAERRTSSTFLAQLSADDLAKTATYRGDGVFSAADFVHEWPFHDHDHVQQILENLKGHYLPHLGSAMRTALTRPN